jgi:hypothetical protein
MTLKAHTDRTAAANTPRSGRSAGIATTTMNQIAPTMMDYYNPFGPMVTGSGRR